MARVNSFGFKVGDKFKVIKADDFNVGEIITLIQDDGTSCPLFENEKGQRDYEYYDYLELIVECPLELAKINLEKAQAEYDAQVKAKEDAMKLQAYEVKSLMVVGVKDSVHLRLVVVSGNSVLFINNSGSVSNHCEFHNLQRELDTHYTKTTKTVQDFFNA